MPSIPAVRSMLLSLALGHSGRLRGLAQLSRFRRPKLRRRSELVDSGITYRLRGAEGAVKSVLNQVVSSPMGAFVVLVIAASLEVLGDSFFQSGLYRSTGVRSEEH